MKQFLSMVLAAVMLLSASVSFAEAVENNVVEANSEVEAVEKTTIEKIGDYVMECFVAEKYDEIFQLCEPEFIGALGGYPESLEIMWSQLIDLYGSVQEIRYEGVVAEEVVNLVNYTVLFEAFEVEFAVVLDQQDMLTNVAVLATRARVMEENTESTPLQ